jgi:hypothetical protein
MRAGRGRQNPPPSETSPVASAFDLNVPSRRPRPSPRTSCGLLHWMIPLDGSLRPMHKGSALADCYEARVGSLALRPAHSPPSRPRGPAA